MHVQGINTTAVNNNNVQNKTQNKKTKRSVKAIAAGLAAGHQEDVRNQHG